MIPLRETKHHLRHTELMLIPRELLPVKTDFIIASDYRCLAMRP